MAGDITRKENIRRIKRDYGSNYYYSMDIYSISVPLAERVPRRKEVSIVSSG
jgi:hypothetical protein